MIADNLVLPWSAVPFFSIFPTVHRKVILYSVFLSFTKPRTISEIALENPSRVTSDNSLQCKTLKQSIFIAGIFPNFCTRVCHFRISNPTL